MEFLSIEQTANKILRLTKNMRQLAEEQGWQEFARLETERQRSLEYLFAHPQISTALQSVADILHQVVLLDQESIELGEAAKRVLAEKLNLNSNAPGAIKVYETTSTL
jgi:hypothetical protein